MGIEAMISPYMHSISNHSVHFAKAAAARLLAVDNETRLPSGVAWQNGYPAQILR